MKLVKIKINNRIDRILNFDGDEQFHNNSYIIRNSSTGPQELFRMSSMPQLIDDQGTKELIVSITEDGDKVTVVFTPKNEKSKQKGAPEGLKLEGNSYVCKRKKNNRSDHFELNFQYQDNDNTTKTISLFIYFATSENSYDAIVDFGSEASQAVWVNGGNDHPVNLTKSIRDLHSDTDIKKADLDKFVQYESKTLYRSNYYVKKSLSSEPTSAWPVYDNGDWKFLKLNTDEVDKNYMQLPNSKLIRFDFGDYTNLVIEVGGNEKQLRLLQNSIVERILLNNIVKQVLKEIVSNADEEKGAYITLNILMPNIYPIHIAAKKLEWLAKDIKDLVQKASGNNSNQANEPSTNQNVSTDQSLIRFDKIRAVELRAISESDASMIGYINTYSADQQINYGTYLIMDAGKGTLDFSFMESVPKGTPYVNRCRAGIVGAGNAVTYGLLVGLVNDYLSQVYRDYQSKTEEEKHRLIQEFIYTKIIDKCDLADLTQLLKAVESYKKVYNNLYNGNPTHATIEESDEAKESMEEMKLSGFTAWITKLVNNRIYLSQESCQFVTYEIERIVYEVEQKLKDMLARKQTSLGDNKDKNIFEKVEGVIFTGRGFLMKELFDKMEAKLKELGIMKPNDTITTLRNESDMKGICININQMLCADQYDIAPSLQTIGLYNLNTDIRTKTESTDLPKKKNRKKSGSDPDFSTSWGDGFGFREANGEYIAHGGGNVSNEGILIPKDYISNSFSISIGGWRYLIKSGFQTHDSVLYFDGINYWLTSEGLTPQEIGDETQDKPKCPLGFESLFPNVVLRSKDQVVIPKKPEYSEQNQENPSESNDAPSDSQEQATEKTGVNERNLFQRIRDMFAPPE